MSEEQENTQRSLSKETKRYRQKRHLGAKKRVSPQWGDNQVIRSGREKFVNAGRHSSFGE